MIFAHIYSQSERGRNMFFFSKTRGMVMGIGFIVLGLFCMVYGTILTVSMKMPATDLYNTDWEKLKANQHVEVDMDFLMDCYMVYERDGEVTGAYYTLPDLWVEEDGIYMVHFMGVAATKDQFSKFDSIVDKSYEWWNDTEGTVEWNNDSVKIDGYLRKMSANDKKYMTELLQDWGYTSTEIDQMMIPYVIMSNGSSMWGMIVAGLLLLVVGGVVLAITIVRIIKSRQENQAFRPANYGTGYGGTYGGGNYGGGNYGGTYGGNNTYGDPGQNNNYDGQGGFGGQG